VIERLTQEMLKMSKLISSKAKFLVDLRGNKVSPFLLGKNENTHKRSGKNKRGRQQLSLFLFKHEDQHSKG
jgi:hypothetical protein